MGVKDLTAVIRKLQKGNKPNQSVFDTELLPKGSIIAMDLNTFLVPFVKSQEGAAQTTTVPVQSFTSVQDKLETIFYLMITHLVLHTVLHPKKHLDSNMTRVVKK